MKHDRNTSQLCSGKRRLSGDKNSPATRCFGSLNIPLVEFLVKALWLPLVDRDLHRQAARKPEVDKQTRNNPNYSRSKIHCNEKKENSLSRHSFCDVYIWLLEGKSWTELLPNRKPSVIKRSSFWIKYRSSRGVSLSPSPRVINKYTAPKLGGSWKSGRLVRKKSLNLKTVPYHSVVERTEILVLLQIFMHTGIRNIAFFFFLSQLPTRNSWKSVVKLFYYYYS